MASKYGLYVKKCVSERFHTESWRVLNERGMILAGRMNEKDAIAAMYDIESWLDEILVQREYDIVVTRRVK